VDRHQPWRGSFAVAVIQFDTEDGTSSTKPSAARPAMEAAGNFVLVFAFGVAIATHSWFAPLLIGAPLVASVCARNRAPEAYCNPSLSLAMLMRRRIAIRDALAFWLIQSGSGLSAATLVCAMVGPRHLAVTAATVKGCSLGAAFAIELIFTLVLCFVAFDGSTGNSRTTHDDNRWPVAIAAMASAVAIGAATGGAFDPDLSFDDAVLAIFSWPTLWIYIVSQLLSGFTATITFVSLSEQR
jgi:aquaporin Z